VSPFAHGRTAWIIGCKICECNHTKVHIWIGLANDSWLFERTCCRLAINPKLHLEAMKPESRYGGMTTNERLFDAGLLSEWEAELSALNSVCEGQIIQDPNRVAGMIFRLIHPASICLLNSETHAHYTGHGTSVRAQSGVTVSW